jgi:membrane complex biogenesis BtpA family protein
MKAKAFDSVFGPDRVGIGVIHLGPLPGSPGYHGGLEAVVERAAEEALALEEAGFHGLVVENYGDIPFLPDVVGPETVASMALAVRAVREASGLPVGVNMLRNDARSALAVAGVCGCGFVRVNVLVGAFVTSEGIIEGRPGEVVRLRERMAADCLIFADVMVKHGVPLGDTGISEQALDAAERGLADCIIVTGRRTGLPPVAEDLMEAGNALRRGTREVPVLVGSGVDPANLESLLGLSRGIIVGSYIREGGVAGAPLSKERAREIGGMLRNYKGKAGGERGD